MTMSSSAAVSDLETSDAELVDRATGLVPLIREYAAQGSEARRVAPEVVKALEDADIFRLLVPKRYGGHGATLRTAVDAVAEVARGDGSTGWIASLMTVGTGFASTASAQAQEDIFGANPKAKVCGVFSPGSKSERVDGGYVVSGRWPFASGSFTADWGSLGVLMEGGEMALALIPAEAWTIEPTWFVSRHAGHGQRHHRGRGPLRARSPDSAGQGHVRGALSHAVHRRTHGVDGLQRGRRRHSRRTADRSGSARAGDHPGQAAFQAGGLHQLPGGEALPTHQLGVANAATKLHLAELTLNRMCLDIDRAAAERRMLDLETRARIRNDTGVVAELVTGAIDGLLTANGAGSFAEVNVLNRIWRDSETAARHALVTPEIGKEAYGRLLLGNEEPTIAL